MLCSRCKSIQR